MAKHFFPKGHKFAPGDARPGAGRKSRFRKTVEAEAKKLAEDYIAAHIEPVLEAYFKLGAGWYRRRFDKKTGKYYQEYVPPDAATSRHWIDKFIPPIQRLEATGKDGRPLVPVTVVTPDANAEWREQKGKEKESDNGE
ncbi:MAG: hypothetical protein OEN50_10960 [Deltaproteobacteria bacterium]|nr:hypothetical protein [Deltaproteobacteria bacterium]